MKLKISQGKLKEDDDKPIKPGESVFSGKTWGKLIGKAKNKNEKELLKVLKAEDKRQKKEEKKCIDPEWHHFFCRAGRYRSCL